MEGGEGGGGGRRMARSQVILVAAAGAGREGGPSETKPDIEIILQNTDLSSALSELKIIKSQIFQFSLFSAAQPASQPALCRESRASCEKYKDVREREINDGGGSPRISARTTASTTTTTTTQSLHLWVDPRHVWHVNRYRYRYILRLYFNKSTQ